MSNTRESNGVDCYWLFGYNGSFHDIDGGGARNRKRNQVTGKKRKHRSVLSDHADSVMSNTRDSNGVDCYWLV